MKWAKRLAWAIAIVIVALALSMIGYAPPRVLDLKNAANRAVAGYAAYYHFVDRFSTVHSTQRFVSGRILHADAQGQIHIPGRFMLKGPLDDWPEAHVFFVYAPDQHNAIPSLPDVGIPGVMEIDGAKSVIKLHDVSDDPNHWLWSLERLYSSVRYDLWPERDSTSARAWADHATLARLVQHVEEEHRAFYDRYRDTRRALPSEADMKWWTPQERIERLRALQTDLEREPDWGSYLDEHWRRKLETLRRDFEKLSQP